MIGGSTGGMGIGDASRKFNVPNCHGEKAVPDVVTSSEEADVSPEVHFKDPYSSFYLGNRRKKKVYKAYDKRFSLVVGKDIHMDRVQHLTECAMLGHLENVKVTFEAMREWLVKHWKPILEYTPLFSTLVNGWYIFHFLSIKDRESISNRPWLLGRGSLVLQQWSVGFNPTHERIRVHKPLGWSHNNLCNKLYK